MKRIVNQKGSTLVTLLIVISILSLIGVTLIQMTLADGNYVKFTVEQQSAQTGVDAAANRFLWCLNNIKNISGGGATTYQYYYEQPYHFLDPDGKPLLIPHTYVNDVGVTVNQGYYSVEVLNDDSDPTTPPKQYVTKHPTVYTLISYYDTKKELVKKVVVQYRRDQFSDYGYISDNEGSSISFKNGDVIDGRFHTNGHLSVENGAIFKKKATYWESYNPIGTVDEAHTFLDGLGVEYIDLHTDISNYATIADYKYQGKTSIVFKAGNVATITKSDGTTVDISTADEGVLIYVGNAGGVQFSDTDSEIGETFSTLNDWGAETNQYSYQTYEQKVKKSNNLGNVFVSGTISGNVTVVAEGNVYIAPSGITKNNETKDILGLVSNQYIYVQHTNLTSQEIDTTTNSNINIQAAIYGARGFAFEEFALDYLYDDPQHSNKYHGKINLVGSLAQNTRYPVSIVSSGSSPEMYGYDKNYTYDTNLRDNVPKDFPEPINLGWSVIGYKEVPMNFNN